MARATSPPFWNRVTRLTAVLVCVWLAASLVGPWFARSLDVWHWFGMPLGLWWAAQGGLVMYLVIIVVYVRRMDALEDEYLQRDETSARPGSDAP